jgi:hypothetical protein
VDARAKIRTSKDLRSRFGPGFRYELRVLKERGHLSQRQRVIASSGWGTPTQKLFFKKTLAHGGFQCSSLRKGVRAEGIAAAVAAVGAAAVAAVAAARPLVAHLAAAPRVAGAAVCPLGAAVLLAGAAASLAAGAAVARPPLAPLFLLPAPLHRLGKTS